MRIAINAFFERHPSTGTGQYTAQLLSALAAKGSPEDYLLLGGAAEGRGDHLSKIRLEQIVAPRRAAEAGAAVLHYPYFAAPLASSVPVVATVHDLIPVLLPAYRGSPLVRLYSALVCAGVRRARLVIADSESTRRDVLRHLDISPARVRVIPLAASSRFSQAPGPAEREAVQRRYALPPRFALYVGGLDQRKNVPRLIEAFALARQRRSLPHYLVIVGSRRPPSRLFPDPAEAARRAGVKNEVVFPGYVPDEDLPALYSLAEAFVYPSLYEGFGLPPLEAMACGTPVVCSEASSLPEVVGDAGLLVRPADVEGLAEALGQVLVDAKLREELSWRGRRRASQFSWERTARATRQIYYEASR